MLTPLFFGVAHLHHAYDFVVHQGCSLREALLMVGGHPSLLLLIPSMARLALMLSPQTLSESV